MINVLFSYDKWRLRLIVIMCQNKKWALVKTATHH